MKYVIQIELETDGLEGERDLNGIMKNLQPAFENVARPYVVVKSCKVTWRPVRRFR